MEIKMRNINIFLKYTTFVIIIVLSNCLGRSSLDDVSPVSATTLGPVASSVNESAIVRVTPTPTELPELTRRQVDDLLGQRFQSIRYSLGLLASGFAMLSTASTMYILNTTGAFQTRSDPIFLTGGLLLLTASMRILGVFEELERIFFCKRSAPRDEVSSAFRQVVRQNQAGNLSFFTGSVILNIMSALILAGNDRMMPPISLSVIGALEVTGSYALCEGYYAATNRGHLGPIARLYKTILNYDTSIPSDLVKYIQQKTSRPLPDFAIASCRTGLIAGGCLIITGCGLLAGDTSLWPAVFNLISGVLYFEATVGSLYGDRSWAHFVTPISSLMR
jgi:hypothetical protein